MFQIVGVSKDGQRDVVATEAMPGEAMKLFRECQAQKQFNEVVVLSPEGREITGFELSRRFTAEQRAIFD